MRKIQEEDWIMLAFSNFSNVLVLVRVWSVKSNSEFDSSVKHTHTHIQREIDIMLVSPTIQELFTPLAFPRDFYYNHNWLQMFKDTTKRLHMLNHTRKRLPNAQSQLKETFKSLQINVFSYTWHTMRGVNN